MPSKDCSDDKYFVVASDAWDPLSLEALFELANELRSKLAPDFELQEVDGELTAVRITSDIPPTRAVPKLRKRDSTGLLSLACLFTVVVLASAWSWNQYRKEGGKGLDRYQPATLADAHRFLAKNSVDPLLYLANRPVKKAVQDTIELRMGQSVPPALTGTTRVTKGLRPWRPREENRFAPAPVPLQGEIGSALPDPSRLTVERDPAPSRPDSHMLEAKVRTFIGENGGRVSRVAEGESSKTLYVSLPSEMTQRLSAGLEDKFGPAVSSSILADDGESSDMSASKAAEIKQAESTVESLKKQLDQAQISFLPGAPVVKSLEAQYASAVVASSEIKRGTTPARTLRVNIRYN